MGNFNELLLEFHGHFKPISEGGGKVSRGSIVPLFPLQDSNVPVQWNYLKRQRVCVFSELPEYYDIGLKHRLKQKNACNSVFNMLLFEFLNAYFEHESNAQ